MKVLALAGLIAAIVFVALVVLQDALQPDHDPVAQPISALAAGPHGWIQNLNFYVLAVLTVSTSIGLHRGVAAGRGDGVALGLWLACACGVLLLAVCPWRRDGDGFVEPLGHTVGAVMTFLCGGLGMIAIARRMARDPRWRSLSRWIFACGVVILCVFVAGVALSLTGGVPLRRWAGLLQRLVLVGWLSCFFAVALRLLRVTRHREG